MPHKKESKYVKPTLLDLKCHRVSNISLTVAQKQVHFTSTYHEKHELTKKTE